jgi:hypothetical protein
LLTYTELKAWVKNVDEAVFADNSKFREALERAREAIKPAITLGSYTQRFDEDRTVDASGNKRHRKPPERAPTVEYLILLYLWLEALFGKGDGKKLSELGECPDERDVSDLKSVLGALDLTLSSGKAEIEPILKEHVRDNHIVSCLAEWLPQLKRDGNRE